ncbi:hypothetical protein [Gemmobacter nectariphilus]|uniref:hypothetical protein n=1 Tax=Gemmobacter nectariphilus TaxID=220343 RepID=UPI0003F9253B|nr:hypothetical protein [Gemmobacter nectariphilus]
MSAAKLLLTLDGRHSEAYLAYSIGMLVKTARHALASVECIDLDEIEARDHSVAETLAIAEALVCVLHEAVAGLGADGQ